MDFLKLGAAWAGVNPTKPEQQEQLNTEGRKVVDTDYDYAPEDRRARLEALLNDWD